MEDSAESLLGRLGAPEVDGRLDDLFPKFDALRGVEEGMVEGPPEVDARLDDRLPNVEEGMTERPPEVDVGLDDRLPNVEEGITERPPEVKGCWDLGGRLNERLSEVETSRGVEGVVNG